MDGIVRQHIRKRLRTIFGNSNRSGHLKMSKVASGVATFAGFFVGYWMAGVLATIPCALIAAYACLHMEQWASADRDQAEKGYWRLYDRCIPHRSIWSHSLIPGTFLRLAYGCLGLPYLLLWILPPVGAAWIVGALVNDAGHLLLDI